MPGGDLAAEGLDDRLAAPLDPDVDLGAEPAATPVERSLAPFFGAPAACWCARTTVPSTNMTPGYSTHPGSLLTGPSP